MKVVLLATYELGRQPFGLASPAAWLRESGHAVTCADLAVQPFPSEAVKQADLVAIHLPMHTATRLSVPLVARIRALNPEAQIAAYGLYAPLNEAFLREQGVHHIVGGEFEPGLVALASGADAPRLNLERLEFRIPDRTALAPATRYARLVQIGAAPRTVAYTEASRGCKHLCRHCPIVPVYEGKFRVVQADVVLEDIRRQVAAGATHVTFGDPDFFNGPTHATRIVEALHREFPQVTYDATIKVEHLLRHRDLLPVLSATGCAFVTSAVESVDDRVLALLEKGHTRADFERAVELCRTAGLRLSPTFIAFTPWTARESYLDMLRTLAQMDLVDSVTPVQLSLRLLITANSRLLELEDIRAVTSGYDAQALVWRWRHPDPEMDTLAAQVMWLVDRRQKQKAGRREIFADIWELASRGARLPIDFGLLPRTEIPYLNEPWYC